MEVLKATVQSPEHTKESKMCVSCTWQNSVFSNVTRK